MITTKLNKKNLRKPKLTISIMLDPAEVPNSRVKVGYYSAGKRDRGKKKKQKLGPPRQGQGGAEGPDAGSFGGGGVRRPPTTRPNTGAPRKKSFRKS